MVNIPDFHCLGDWESFTRAWCDGYGNHLVRDPALLGDHLRREGLILRRTKQEVLTELPPKRRLVQEIDADDRVYREPMRPVIELLGSPACAAPRSEGARHAGGAGRPGRTAGHGRGLPFVAAFCARLLDNGEKVLLFAHHHAVMDVYKKELASYRPAFITGRDDTAEERRGDAVHGGEDEPLRDFFARGLWAEPAKGELRGLRRTGLVARGAQPSRGQGAPHGAEGFDSLCYLVAPQDRTGICRMR